MGERSARFWDHLLEIVRQSLPYFPRKWRLLEAVVSRAQLG